LVEGVVFLKRQAHQRENMAASKSMNAEGETPSPVLTPRALRVLFIILILCLVAVLLNPHGARMFAYPLETLTSRAMQAYIQEWFAPDFHLLEWQPFAWLILALLASTLLARARVPLAQTLLLFALGYAALRSARNIPLFVVVAVPVLATQLAALFNWRPGAAHSAPGLIRFVNATLLALVGLAALVRVATVIANQSQVEREK
jgi:hypothetical protein